MRRLALLLLVSSCAPSTVADVVDGSADVGGEVAVDAGSDAGADASTDAQGDAANDLQGDAGADVAATDALLD